MVLTLKVFMFSEHIVHMFFVWLIIVLITDVLKYSGDQDSVIPLTGSRTLVNQLAKELGLKTTVPYRVWFEGQQVISMEMTKI